MSKVKLSLSGALAIDKPAGMTSHDVVAIVRRQLKIKRVGHAGTLDPFATGVLLVVMGTSTRLSDYTHLLPKTYETTVTLGATSTTDDATGELTPSSNNGIPTEDDVRAALRDFQGQQQQVPPAYAAIKLAGKKLYQYARAGESVSVPARAVTIHEITLVEYQYPTLKILVTCSSGTYIRALGRDIGQKLQTGAYLSYLCRTAIGQFTINNAITLNQIQLPLASPPLIPPEQLVAHLSPLILDTPNVVKLQQGRVAALPPTSLPSSPLALYDPAGALVGIGTYDKTTRFLKSRVIL